MPTRRSNDRRVFLYPQITRIFANEFSFASIREIRGLNKVLLSREATGIFQPCRMTKSRQQGKAPYCDGHLLFA
jgi:hypothetical protein